MSLQVLTDEELRTKVAEARSFIDGLVRECNARKWLLEATILGNAEIACHEVGSLLLGRSLPAWQFVKPDGSVGVCAWCQQEQSVVPMPHESHGICPRHLNEQKAQLRRMQEARAA